jgi:hypothetical protein
MTVINKMALIEEETLKKLLDDVLKHVDIDTDGYISFDNLELISYLANYVKKQKEKKNKTNEDDKLREWKFVDKDYDELRHGDRIKFFNIETNEAEPEGSRIITWMNNMHINTTNNSYKKGEIYNIYYCIAQRKLMEDIRSQLTNQTTPALYAS